MMAQDNKTEQATLRRRQRAREKGQVARSRDLIGAASGMAATMLLASQLPHFPQAWREFFHAALDGAASGSLRLDGLPPFLAHSGVFAATAAALGMGWIVAVSSALAQGGVVFAPSSLLPQASRISPAAKCRQLFSIAALRGLAKSLLPVAALAAVGKHPVLLVEAVRQALGRALVRPLLSDDGGLRVLTLDQSIEEELGRAFAPQSLPATSTGLQPSFVRRVLESLRQLAGEQVAQTAPVLLCSTPARFHLRRLLEPFLPKIVVLSPLEIPPMVPVQSLGTVR
jgi:FlhB/HrpN/YscU/SpaS family protein/FHIPEP family protein